MADRAAMKASSREGCQSDERDGECWCRGLKLELVTVVSNWANWGKSTDISFFTTPLQKRHTINGHMNVGTVNNTKMALNLESLAGIHPDQCSSSNFLSPDYEHRYDTVSEFLAEFAENDPWLNVCVRWDIERHEDGTGYHVRIAILQQRKGLFIPVRINRVEQTHLPLLLSFLRRHWEYLRAIWKPLSEDGCNESVQGQG